MTTVERISKLNALVKALKREVLRAKTLELDCSVISNTISIDEIVEEVREIRYKNYKNHGNNQ